MTMRRIIIIGVTGSGKTTLGNDLSARLGISAIDLDDIHWLPDWQTRDLVEARQMIGAATQKPAWVISGNYSKFQDIFWPLADTVLWLDYSFPRIFWQLLRRSVLRIVGRQPACNGNYETWKKFFSRGSIMVWLFQSFRKRRRVGHDIFSHPEQHSHLTLIRLRHPKQAAEWLESINHA